MRMIPSFFRQMSGSCYFQGSTTDTVKHPELTDSSTINLAYRQRLETLELRIINQNKCIEGDEIHGTKDLRLYSSQYKGAK